MGNKKEQIIKSADVVLDENRALKDAVKDMESKVKALDEVVCKECKQIEASNVKILNKMEAMEITLDQQEKLMTRIRTRLGL
tara:strand:+ start:404 stop:649 length:246 start_codon:yes stop_codon:yes gene_type:complete